MANFIFTPAMNLVVAGSLPLNTSTYKVMLLNAALTTGSNQANTAVSSFDTNEIGTTINPVDNYGRGFNGNGRKVVTLSLTSNTTNPVGVIFSANITWTALGGTINDTIRGCALIKEVTTDADSIPIAYWDISPAVTTNGSNFTITITPTTGNISFAV